MTEDENHATIRLSEPRTIKPSNNRPFTSSYFDGKFHFEYTDTFRYRLKLFWAWIKRGGRKQKWVTYAFTYDPQKSLPPVGFEIEMLDGHRDTQVRTAKPDDGC